MLFSSFCFYFSSLSYSIYKAENEIEQHVESIPEFYHILKFWFLDQFFSFVNDYKVTSKILGELSQYFQRNVQCL